MSWRTIIISNRSKLDLKMGYMIVRGEETKRVFLDEISVLIIENPSVSITGCLLEELAIKKVKVIFCDGKHTPYAEMTPYYGSYDCSKKIKQQIAWSDIAKGLVWSEIVAQKIKKQSEMLIIAGKNKEADMLKKYISQIEYYDKSNREGHAAKVYFNALFGMEFTRNNGDIINSALNYGYSIILSAFCREITAAGYLTQLGIFHDNIYNHYNLSCDLMEPYRILIDKKVYCTKYKQFETKEKHFLVNTLNEIVMIDGTKQTVLNAIRIYIRSVCASLNNADTSLISNYSLI